MIFSDILELVDHIARTHTSFNGRSCRPGACVMVFDTLARAQDYIKREPAAKSCTFDAAFQVDGVPVNTLITVDFSGEQIICTEEVKH